MREVAGMNLPPLLFTLFTYTNHRTSRSQLIVDVYPLIYESPSHLGEVREAMARDGVEMQVVFPKLEVWF